MWGAGIIGFWVLVAIGAVLLGGGLWVRQTFGVISLDQMIMNLPGGGAEGGGGTDLVSGAVQTALIVPLACVLVLAFLSERTRRRLRTRNRMVAQAGAVQSAGRARTVKPATWLLRCTAVVLAVAVPLGGATFLGSTVGVDRYVASYVRDTAVATGYADYYVDPLESGAMRTAIASGADATRGKPRNLVLIYLESVEDALSDDTVFEEDMLAPLTTATAGWDSIERLEQYEGGGWTMAGIVSTQCGIPLRTPGALTNPNEISVDTFLPGATCLGDVLREQGYHNVFLGGANAEFAGKETFLDTHGYDEVLDLRHWLELGDTEIRPDWGLSDRALFGHARDEIQRLHAADEPFNLTVLTLDTHDYPWAHDYCEVDTAAEMTAITACSMREVASFVDDLGEMGVLEDTVVMLMGDHLRILAPSNSYWDELGDYADRTIFNRVWVPGGVEFARDEIDQLSMFATLLELVGIEPVGHRAGIGVSALAGPGQVPLGSILDLSEAEYLDLVSSRSTSFFEQMWGNAAQLPAPVEATGDDSTVAAE